METLKFHGEQWHNSSFSVKRTLLFFFVVFWGGGGFVTFFCLELSRETSALLTTFSSGSGSSVSITLESGSAIISSKPLANCGQKFAGVNSPEMGGRVHMLDLHFECTIEITISMLKSKLLSQWLVWLWQEPKSLLSSTSLKAKRQRKRLSGTQNTLEL